MEFTAHGTWDMNEKKRGVQDDCILEPFERMGWGRKDRNKFEGKRWENQELSCRCSE